MPGKNKGRKATGSALSVNLSAFVRTNKKTEDAYRTLAEVFELLEEYGPVWYSNKLRTKIMRLLKRPAEPAKKSDKRKISSLRKR